MIALGCVRLPRCCSNVKETRIALIDDEPSFVDLFNRALRSECPEARLTTYSTGADFLNALPGLTGLEQPDVILLDLNMPALNGWTVTAAIRRYASYRAGPIILLTILEPSDLPDQAVNPEI